MSHRASPFPRASRLFTGYSRTPKLILALTLACAGVAQADIWHHGDVFTYDQGDWADQSSVAGMALLADYGSVYFSTGGQLVVGSPPPANFYLVFTNVSALFTYLPANNGAPGPLTISFVNPTVTASGPFGGEVVALKLIVDFTDAGFLLGTSGIPAGDLVLENFSTLPALNGLTVRQFLGDVNTLLGGGSSIYSIADLDPIAKGINDSFSNGVVSTFATDHLARPTSAVPEPSSLLLLIPVVLGLGLRRRPLRR